QKIRVTPELFSKTPYFIGIAACFFCKTRSQVGTTALKFKKMTGKAQGNWRFSLRSGVESHPSLPRITFAPHHL
ncbi:hypothetical protein, partial [Celeribacter sp. ULVN23_4]